MRATFEHALDRIHALDLETRHGKAATGRSGTKAAAATGTRALTGQHRCWYSPTGAALVMLLNHLDFECEMGRGDYASKRCEQLLHQYQAGTGGASDHG